jgi:hypothetical protein
VDPATKESLALVGKSLLFVLGGIVAVAALVQLVVSGPEWEAALYLLVGLALMVPPLALAFRDAVRNARAVKGGPGP